VERGNLVYHYKFLNLSLLWKLSSAKYIVCFIFKYCPIFFKLGGPFVCQSKRLEPDHTPSYSASGLGSSFLSIHQQSQLAGRGLNLSYTCYVFSIAIIFRSRGKHYYPVISCFSFNPWPYNTYQNDLDRKIQMNINIKKHRKNSNDLTYSEPQCHKKTTWIQIRSLVTQSLIQDVGH